MQMTLRWFGVDDAVTLANIRQIPGVTGIVSALHDERPGDVWPQDRIDALRDNIAEAGLSLAVIESIPVHEDIKLGRPSRDRHADSWCETVRRLGAAGIPVVCYNFMPIFDWLRTDLARATADGSTTLAYDHRALAVDGPVVGLGLPAGVGGPLRRGDARRAAGGVPPAARGAPLGAPRLVPRARGAGGRVGGGATGAPPR